MIRIKYNDIEGVLNTFTEEVMFYQFKYKNIIEAISNVEHDLQASEKEIEIFNSLLNGLNFISD